MRVTIIGCGYLGKALGIELLRQGHQVLGVVRTQESAADLDHAGLKSLSADCATREGAARIWECPSDMVVLSLAANGKSYKESYLESMWQITRAFQTRPPQTFIYTSSTSVYGVSDGSWVDENRLANPSHPDGKILLETEAVLQKASAGKFDTAILRLSGIYGPGRHRLLDQLREGVAAWPQAGLHWMNHIHRDDAVSAILHCLTKASGFEIYNVSDNEPVLQSDYVAWVCQKLGRALPAFPSTSNIEHRTSNLQRFRSHQRISNSKLKETGWKPKYPSFREGLATLLRAE